MTDEEHGLHKEPRPSEHRKLSTVERGREWQGLGAASDFVFTSETGRPLGRERIAKRGVTRAATQAGLGHVTPQVLRRSVATLTAHARVPTVIAAAMTGHSPRVYDEHYAKPFRDAEERKRDPRIPGIGRARQRHG